MLCSRPAQAYRATNSAAASPVRPSRAASFTPYASVHAETASPCLRRLSPPVHSCNTCNARCRECSAIIRISPVPARLHLATSGNRERRTDNLPVYSSDSTLVLLPFSLGILGNYPLTVWLPGVTLGTPLVSSYRTWDAVLALGPPASTTDGNHDGVRRTTGGTPLRPLQSGAIPHNQRIVPALSQVP